MTRLQKYALAGAGGVAAAIVAARAVREGRRIDFRGKTVAIVGGSRGLGLIIARQLADEGAKVALVARDAEELERARQDLLARGAEVAVFACDVRNRAQVETTLDRIASRFGRLDVLVNDAGVIQVGPFEHMTLEDFEEAMGVHFWGPLFATLGALPMMRRQGGGRIVNISSIGGKVAVPHLLPYSASKFALVGLSDGLRAELAKDNILVTTVCPGLMRTGSPLNAWFKGRHRDEFTWFAISDALPGLSIDARRAAAQVIDACRHGDPELVITLQARLAVMANAIAPSLVARAMAIANRLLPAPAADAGHERRSGWQSPSRWAPSLLTRFSDRASAENNELPESA